MNMTDKRVGRDEPTLAQRHGTDRRIARVVFVFIIAVILAGFAKNFYLRAWLGNRLLIPTAWLHGFVMSAWLTLFAIQVVMVARRRVDLHRRLGTFGAALAVLVVAVGMVTIIVRARIVFPRASLAQYSAVFVAFDGLSLLLFGVFVACALRQRAHSAVHRRLMTMAMVALLPPAFGRIVAYLTHHHVEITVLSLMVLTVLLCVAVDFLRSGQIRGPSLAPGLFIVLVNVATYFAQVAT